jgi:hypothetical protein
MKYRDNTRFGINWGRRSFAILTPWFAICGGLNVLDFYDHSYAKRWSGVRIFRTCIRPCFSGKTLIRHYDSVPRMSA